MGKLFELKNTIEELLKKIDNINNFKSNNDTKNNSVTTEQYKGSVYDIDTLKDEIDKMQTDLQHKIEAVHKQAFIDRLTSLKNRTAYMETINDIDAHINDNTSFSVAVFDICGLKSINDDYGHEAGDIAIIDAAKILKNVFDKDDLYRFGGDEFIGILNISSKLDISELFNNLDDEINNYNMKSNIFKFPLHISKGWSSYCKETDTSIEKCLNEQIQLCIMIKRYIIRTVHLLIEDVELNDLTQPHSSPLRDLGC